MDTQIMTTELKDKISVLLDQGKGSGEIATILNIPLENLKDMFQKDKAERLIKKAEKDSEGMLDLDLSQPDLERKFGKNTLALMKLKQNERFFILETQGKDMGYSKRSEITGKNGEEIKIKEIIFSAPVMPTQPKN